MKKLTKEHICLIPLAVWFIIIPIIVKVKYFANPLTEYAWYSSDETMADFFLYYKSMWVTIIGALMLVLLIWRVAGMKRKDTLFCTDTRIFIPILVYLFLAIASSLFSEYGYFPVHGMPDQFETIWNLIAYVVAVLFCYYVVVYHDFDKSLLGIVFIGAALVSIICVLQFFKIDIYRLIYAGDGYSFSFALGTVYGPFYNINYVGYYTLLFVPIFIMLFISCKNIGVRIASALLTVALMITMVGAKSTAAWVGFAGALGFAIIFILIKNAVKKKALWIPIAAIAVCAIAGVVLAMPRINAYLAASDTAKTNLEAMYTHDDNVEIDYKGNELHIQMLEEQDFISFNLYDQDGAGISYSYQVSEDESYYYYTVDDERFAGIMLTPALISEDPTIYGFAVSVDDRTWNFTNGMTDDGTYYYYSDLGKITKLTEDTVSDSFTPLAHLSGLANGRGYIWNKSIAMLKSCIFLGSGADTYAVAFPNGDFVDKYNNGYDNLILTKPHCLYLQIATQTGVLSLICFLAFYIWYFISSARLYFRQRLTTPLAAVGFAIMLGTAAYMISGLANDSTITIAPLYWALMGAGVGVNRRVRVGAKA